MTPWSGIDLGGVVGDERPKVGRTVLEHLLHISAGDCVTWEDGQRVVHETFVETGTAPMGGLGETLLYETAHPEAVTMPRRYPQAQRVRVIGGLDPAPFKIGVLGAVWMIGWVTAVLLTFTQGRVLGRCGSDPARRGHRLDARAAALALGV